MNLCLLLRQDAFLARDSFQRGTRPLPSQVARATPTDCFSPNGHPPFAPFFRAHIFRQVISWSIKHFSRLKWNKMRVFQKHFHNFLAVVRIPHCDFLVCLTWIRPIPPKSPPRYSDILFSTQSFPNAVSIRTTNLLLGSQIYKSVKNYSYEYLMINCGLRKSLMWFVSQSLKNQKPKASNFVPIQL